jgi:hypothetical protein
MASFQSDAKGLDDNWPIWAGAVGRVGRTTTLKPQGTTDEEGVVGSIDEE